MDKETWLEMYLQGSLTPAQEAELQAKMAADSEWAAEFAFALELREALARKEYEKLKTEVVAVSQKAKRNKRWQWAIAASLTLLLIVSSFGWFEANESQASELLYATYFQPYRNVIAPEVRGDEEASQLAEAFEAYDREEFGLALQNFETLEASNPAIRLYQANALLMTEQPESAITLLVADSAVGDSFSRERWWYLGLAYLKADQREAAQEALNHMQQIEGRFKAKEAQELLGLLEGSFAEEDH